MEPISIISILFNLASLNISDQELKTNSNLQFESVYEAKQFIFNDNNLYKSNSNSDLLASYRIAMINKNSRILLFNIIGKDHGKYKCICWLQTWIYKS